MNEQKRIENPTCETCRWFANKGNEYSGFCALNPPVVFQTDMRGDYESLHPIVSNGDYCSHHESAFEDESKPFMWTCEWGSFDSGSLVGEKRCETLFANRGDNYEIGAPILCEYHRNFK